MRRNCEVSALLLATRNPQPATPHPSRPLRSNRAQLFPRLRGNPVGAVVGVVAGQLFEELAELGNERFVVGAAGLALLEDLVFAAGQAQDFLAGALAH